MMGQRRSRDGADSTVLWQGRPRLWSSGSSCNGPEFKGQWARRTVACPVVPAFGPHAGRSSTRRRSLLKQRGTPRLRGPCARKTRSSMADHSSRPTTSSRHRQCEVHRSGPIGVPAPRRRPHYSRRSRTRQLQRAGRAGKGRRCPGGGRRPAMARRRWLWRQRRSRAHSMPHTSRRNRSRESIMRIRGMHRLEQVLLRLLWQGPNR
mmetsp:Transcript_15942/g.55421  ORF Transcript_15942/g.55421 Transcript_15942/m.55421 type:complete len:206 (+) Transcript_15942:616-1233(+)